MLTYKDWMEYNLGIYWAMLDGWQKGMKMTVEFVKELNEKLEEIERIKKIEEQYKNYKDFNNYYRKINRIMTILYDECGDMR